MLGAGISGLTAGLALHGRGHDVEVLEYQDRVGGRLISLPLKDGQFTEGGGGHFRTIMPLVCGYINKFKLPLIAMNDGCPIYHVDGKVGDGTLMTDWPWEVHEDERLPQALAQVLGKRIHLGTPVVSIRQTATQAIVTTSDGTEWVADEVVSTIPFPVLRELEIVPKLMPRKQELVDQLGWSPVVKVYVQTQSAPWLRKGVRGWPMAASDRPWERIVDITGNEPGGHGNVFFYMTGKNAEAYLHRPKESRANELLAQFRADLPGLLDDVITIGEFSWPDQPWIKAAFADLPVGGGWMIQEWQIPEGRLHFAGDFTTLKSGWVEGAIESGLRAARQIDPGALAEFET